MQSLIIKLLDDLRGSWRFRWLGLAAAWAACLIGWLYVFAMPNVYEAKARVYVDSKTVLRRFDSVSSGPNSRKLSGFLRMTS